MKRTPLTRKTPLAQGAGLKTRKPMKRTAAKRRPTKAKASSPARWRSATYLAWVRAQPCCFCGLGPSDPHHVIGLHWGLSGEALTAPDNFAMPLCRKHHDAVHGSPELQQQQPDWLRWTIARGVREFDGEIRAELVRAWEFIDEKEAA